MSIEKYSLLLEFSVYPWKGWWTAPGGSAIPGQSAERAKQASFRSPDFKNSFDRKVAQWTTYQRSN